MLYNTNIEFVIAVAEMKGEYIIQYHIAKQLPQWVMLLDGKLIV